MCRIAGFLSFGGYAPKKEIITRLWGSMEDGGKDACGIAYVTHPNPTEIKLLKSAVPSRTFINGKTWAKTPFEDVKMAVIHTRLATNGKPENPANNHPFLVKGESQIALVHNGNIPNWKDVAEEKGLTLVSECDTEILLRILESRWWADVGNLGWTSGSYAIAAMNATKQEIILARSTSKLVMWYDKGKDVLWWATSRGYLDGVFDEYKRGFLAKNVVDTIEEVPDDHAMLITMDGLKEVKKVPKAVIWKKTVGQSSSWGWQKGDDGVWRGWEGNQTEKLVECSVCKTHKETSRMVKTFHGKMCYKCFYELYKDSDLRCNVCGKPVDYRDVLKEVCPYGGHAMMVKIKNFEKHLTV